MISSNRRCRASPIRKRSSQKIFSRMGAGSDCRWRTNEVGQDGPEDHERFPGKVRHRDWLDHRQHADNRARWAQARRRADRAGVMGCQGTNRMRVDRLHRPHGAYQRYAQHAQRLEDPASLCRHLYHAVLSSLIHVLDGRPVTWEASRRGVRSVPDRRAHILTPLPGQNQGKHFDQTRCSRTIAESSTCVRLSVVPSSSSCTLPATAEFGAAGSDPGRSIYVRASDLIF